MTDESREQHAKRIGNPGMPENEWCEYLALCRSIDQARLALSRSIDQACRPPKKRIWDRLVSMLSKPWS